MTHSQFLDLHDRLVQSIETPFGNLVEQFPVGCVVTELHGASQRTGKVVDHRPMRDLTGLYPVVAWIDGITAFSSPDWQLRKLSSPVDRLVFLLQLHQPDCQIMQNLKPITISTPGGTFDLQLKPQLKLLPAIPSPRYQKLMALVSSRTELNTPPIIPLDKGDGDNRRLHKVIFHVQVLTWRCSGA